MKMWTILLRDGEISHKPTTLTNLSYHIYQKIFRNIQYNNPTKQDLH